MNGDVLWYVDGIRFVRLLFLRLLIKPRLFTDRIGCRLWLRPVPFHCFLQRGTATPFATKQGGRAESMYLCFFYIHCF